MASAILVATCPDCGRKIELWPRSKVGDELVCPHCDADLEVVSMDPPELSWASLEPADDDEDWKSWED